MAWRGVAWRSLAALAGQAAWTPRTAVRFDAPFQFAARRVRHPGDLHGFGVELDRTRGRVDVLELPGGCAGDALGLKVQRPLENPVRRAHIVGVGQRRQVCMVPMETAPEPAGTAMSTGAEGGGSEGAEVGSGRAGGDLCHRTNVA